MTVAENILLAAVGTESEKIQKLRENLVRFELTGLENSYPHELSGGQQQRVAFARILTSHAKLLLLDEPFSALDSHLKWRLELQMEEIFQTYGGSAILVSHDRDEVFRLSNRIAVMTQGKIVETNGKHELFKNPQTKAAAVLTGCKNISAARKIDSGKIFAEDWQITLALNRQIPDGLKFVGIHSHFLEKASTTGENVFEFALAQEIEDTFFYIVMLRAGQNLIRWEVAKKFWQEIRADKIFLRFPADKIILMSG